MQAPDFGSFSATLRNLFEKGVRYATVVDLGCADGHFVLTHLPYLGGAVPLNIDANRIYENSLKSIKEVVGGHYPQATSTGRGSTIWSRARSR